MRAVGMMSGTSLDGIDLALVETDGEVIEAFGPVASFPYDAYQAERTLIFRAMEDAADLTDRRARPGCLPEAEEAVTRLNIRAVSEFLKDVRADVIGFHGQTVIHRPEIGLTVQLGDAAAMAAATGLPVVHDFRAADMAAGGQGAPLVPIFHRAIAEKLDGERPIAVLNLGGVANVTYLDANGAVPIACDVGPANALLDDFIRARTGRPLDGDGAAAAAGTVDTVLLERLLQHPFFGLKPPKSLDRNAFRAWVAGMANFGAMSLEDGAALLTAFTAAAAARIVAHLPRPPVRWVLTGGGARNPVMVRMLAERLAPARAETADAAGWSGDHVEAQAFAFLAVRAVKGLPLTFPSTTGVTKPTVGGVITRP